MKNNNKNYNEAESRISEFTYQSNDTVTFLDNKSSTLLDSYAGLLQECNLYIENNSRGITTKTTKQRLVTLHKNIL